MPIIDWDEIKIKFIPEIKQFERDKGIGPSTPPWEGDVLPLYESRKQMIF